MPVQAMGPTYAGGTQPIVSGGYSLLYLPDVNNRELQNAGEAPVFYYVPNQVRMARKDGPDSGDFLFNLVRFAGTGGGGVIGGGGEVAGGVLTFSVTGAAPEHVRRQAEAEITERFQGSDDYFWGIRPQQTPMFRPAIISSNITTVSNVAPTARGFPTVATRSRNGIDTMGFDYFGMPGHRAGARPMPQLTRDDPTGTGGQPGAVPAVPGGAGSPESAPGQPPVLTNGSGSNLDPWYWQMHGNGSGSIDPTGTHAFSGLLGAYPTAICWEAFHGTASPLIVIQNYKLKVWSPVVTLDITGDWERIHDHFSVAASGRYLWASADVQAEFNNMRTSGAINVSLKVDSTLPGADEIARRLDEKSNLVYEKFMEAANSIIFEPPPPQIEAAEASSSGGGFFSPWGVGVSLKKRVDTTSLRLEYHEEQQLAYLQDHTISSSLAGMYDEMRRDPEAERKYFLSVYLDDWPRKLARVCRPVAAWEDGNVDFMSVQIGYPNTRGEINWEGHSFSGTEGEDGSWKYQTAQKPAEDVDDPPEGWKPDLTFVKRKVHLAEPPSETADPYRRVQIERNVIDIDPEPNGDLINDTTIEVRADSAGQLAVGPIELGVVLGDNTQMVEAVFEPVDSSGAPIGRPQVRFRWEYDDYDEDRIWTVYTGDPEFRPFYRYKVFVTVKGTLFEAGRAWEGPWVRASGNGPLVVDVPRPDGEGVVVTRTMPEQRELPAGTDDGSALPAARQSAARRTAPVRRGVAAGDAGANGHRTYLEYSL